MSDRCRHDLYREFGSFNTMREVPEFTRIVSELATWYGWMVLHIPDSRLIPQAVGWPDFTIYRDRKVHYWELKRQGESPTPEQRAVGKHLPGWKVMHPRDLYNGIIEDRLV